MFAAVEAIRAARARLCSAGFGVTRQCATSRWHTEAGLYFTAP